MAVNPRALAKWFGAPVALSLSAVALISLPESDNQTTQPPQMEPLQGAIDALRSGDAQAEAEEVANEDGLIASGAPCFMRHKRVALGVDRTWRHQFAAATLATGTALKDVLLSQLASAPPSSGDKELAAWRIALERAELALRSGRKADAVEHLAYADSFPVPESCRADTAFLAAALADTPREAARYLDAAVAADPGFRAAQEQLALLAARGTGADPDACMADAVRVIRTVTQLAALTTVDGEFARLQRNLAGIAPNGRRALLQGMIFEATGSADTALETYRSGLDELGNAACDLTLRTALEGMMSLMDRDV